MIRAVTCPNCRNPVPVPPAGRDTTVECPGCGHEFTPAADEPYDLPPTPPPRVFAVTPYRPVGSGPPLGVGTAAAAGMIGALALAFACSALRHHVWIIVLFPVLHGLAVGLVVGCAARVAKARFPIAIGAVGVTCALVSYLGVHYLDYARLAALPGVPRLGFWEYMDLRAMVGVRLGDAGRGLGYAGSVAFWCVEAGLTAGVAGAVASGLVRGPVCERCGRWKGPQLLGPYLTEPDYAVPQLVAGHVEGMAAPMTVPGSVRLTLYTCPTCGGEAPVQVKATGARKEGRKFVTTTVVLTYPGEALMAFEAFDRSCRPPA